MEGVKTVELIKIVSWPGITLEVSQQFAVLLWVVLVMSVLLLLFCTLISGAIVMYTTFYLVKHKFRIPWTEMKEKLSCCLKKDGDQHDGIISTNDILYEANQEIERIGTMENIIFT